MKKWLRALAMCMLAMMIICVMAIPALAEAAEGAPNVDWTPVVVAIIGVLGGGMAALLSRVWMKYVKPWLEQRDLSDAAEIVVNAVEAILGRYCGPDKWKLALEKMAGKGFYTESETVADALKAAWTKLNLSQIAAGVKAPEGAEEKPPDVGENG